MNVAGLSTHPASLIVDAISMAVTRKAQDAAELQGQAVVKLLQQAGEVQQMIVARTNQDGSRLDLTA